MRVVTYNIRHGLGLDGRLNLKGIASCLLQLKPDIVTLNEVDKNLPRSRFANQAKVVAQYLGFNHCYDPTLNFRFGAYGNAILSRWPLQQVVSLKLPVVGEPRKFSLAKVAGPYGEFYVGCTHLGLDQEERAMQLWTIGEKVRDLPLPVIFAGDFNEEVKATWFSSLGIRQALDYQGGRICTFPATKARTAIDHIFFSEHYSLERAFSLAKGYSDHQPLITDLSTK